MKKIILLFTLTVFVSTMTKAQSGLHAGVQLGYYLVGMVNGPSTNSTSVYANPYTHFDTKFSSKFGVEAGYGFIDAVGVQAELNFATLGQSATGTSTGGASVSRKIDLNYVEIPLLVKLRTPGEVAHYYFMAGPQFNFLSSATITDDKVPTVADAKSHFKSTDVGVMFDTGLEIEVSKLFFNLGLRAYYGLSDPNATAYQLASSASDYKASHNFSGGLNLGAHYKF